jgi:hypothetical protein
MISSNILIVDMMTNLIEAKFVEQLQHQLMAYFICYGAN